MSSFGTLDLIDLFAQQDGPTWANMIQVTSGTTELREENPEEHTQMTALFLDKVFKETDEAVAGALFALCARDVTWNQRVTAYCTDHPAQKAFLERLLAQPAPAFTLPDEQVFIGTDGFQLLPETEVSFNELLPLIEQGKEEEFQTALEQIPGDIPEDTMFNLLKAAAVSHPNPNILGILIDRFAERQNVREYCQELLISDNLNEGIRVLLQVAVAPEEEVEVPLAVPANAWAALDTTLRNDPAGALPQLFAFLEAGNVIPEPAVPFVWEQIITHAPDGQTIQQFTPFLNQALSTKTLNLSLAEKAFRASLNRIHQNLGGLPGQGLQKGFGFMWLRALCNDVRFCQIGPPLVQIMMEYHLPMMFVVHLLNAVQRHNPNLMLPHELASQLRNYCARFSENPAKANLDAPLNALCPPEEPLEDAPPPSSSPVLLANPSEKKIELIPANSSEKKERASLPPSSSEESEAPLQNRTIEEEVDEAVQNGNPDEVSRLREAAGAWIINPWWAWKWVCAWWNPRPQA